MQCTETAYGQHAQVATREIAMRYQETNVHHEQGRTLEQVTQRNCGTSVLGETQTCLDKVPDANSLLLRRGLDQIGGLLS